MRDVLRALRRSYDPFRVKLPRLGIFCDALRQSGGLIGVDRKY